MSRHRDSLWRLVNITDGSMLLSPWGDIPAGARGTLVYIGSGYATIKLASYCGSTIRPPIVCIGAYDELAARRRRA